MTVVAEPLLMSGQIQNYMDKQWYPYQMRILSVGNLPSMLSLYDLVIENLERPDMLWRYPDEMVAEFLGKDGLVAGVFVEEELVGFRVLYFHHPGDETNPLLCTGASYGETAHLALSVIHPDFRGNSLQKKMSGILVAVAQAARVFPAMCSVVSPHNYPSINDKFSVNMVVIKLIPKFSGVWRYIFYRNMDNSIRPTDEKIIFVSSDDYLGQIELLEQGYYGVQIGISNGEKGMFFRK